MTRFSDLRGSRFFFRSMLEEDGSPSIGPTNYQLGVRTNAGPYSDIKVDENGDVHPDTGGMSVSPDHPEHLPFYRRPPEWKGKATWQYPVWAISEEQLGPHLSFRPSEDNPGGHGYIEPAHAMPFDRYREALEATRPDWEIVVP